MGCFFSRCDDLEKARRAKPPTCDIYRDSPLRALGYAGHLAVCSSILSPRAILTGQMISTAYILGDVFQKASDSAKKLEPESTVIKKSFDAFAWQLLASVIIPGFILSRTRSVTRNILRKTGGTCGPNPILMKWLPCVAGLALAPFIMKPIDNCVDYIIENTSSDWTTKGETVVKKGEKKVGVKA